MFFSEVKHSRRFGQLLRLERDDSTAAVVVVVVCDDRVTEKVKVLRDV